MQETQTDHDYNAGGITTIATDNSLDPVILRNPTPGISSHNSRNRLSAVSVDGKTQNNRNSGNGNNQNFRNSGQGNNRNSGQGSNRNSGQGNTQNPVSVNAHIEKPPPYPKKDADKSVTFPSQLHSNPTIPGTKGPFESQGPRSGPVYAGKSPATPKIRMSTGAVDSSDDEGTSDPTVRLHISENEDSLPRKHYSSRTPKYNVTHVGPPMFIKNGYKNVPEQQSNHNSVSPSTSEDEDVQIRIRQKPNDPSSYVPVKWNENGSPEHTDRHGRQSHPNNIHYVDKSYNPNRGHNSTSEGRDRRNKLQGVIQGHPSIPI